MKVRNAAKEEIKAYKHVLENDGLGTYIIYDNWTKPDQIREILRKLYKDKSAPPLRGRYW